MPDKQQAKWVGTGMKRKEDLRLFLANATGTDRATYMEAAQQIRDK